MDTPIPPEAAKLIAINTAVQFLASTLAGVFDATTVANAMMAQAMVLSGAEPDVLKAYGRVQAFWRHLQDELKAEMNAAGGAGENIVPIHSGRVS